MAWPTDQGGCSSGGEDVPREELNQIQLIACSHRSVSLLLVIGPTTQPSKRGLERRTREPMLNTGSLLLSRRSETGRTETELSPYSPCEGEEREDKSSVLTH
jgi:hypothetical protein